jgi:CubicO group peptidase (beta-lactamase class C family)
LAEDADLRLRAPKRFWKELLQANDNETTTSSNRDARLPAPGTVLKRHYQGQNIAVTVLEEGFLYDNQNYGSLSAIAHRVTGTRWNGYLFFGLMKSS